MSQSAGTESHLSYLLLQVAVQLWYQIYETVRQFVALYLMDPTRVGPGFHFLSSALTISYVHLFWAILVDINDSVNPWVVNSLHLIAWQRAWVFHRHRDPQLPSRYLGRLNPWILGVIELVPVPDWVLAERAQSRYWMPAILYLSGKGMTAFLCPTTGTLMQMSAIFLVVPKIFAAIKETIRRRRMEGMIQSAQNSLSPSRFTPVDGHRGAWAQRHFQQITDCFALASDVDPEAVICPACQTELDCHSVDSNTFVSCPCGQQFQLVR